MRYTPKKKKEKEKKPDDIWFAWYPVKTVEGVWVWLEKVRFEREVDLTSPSLFGDFTFYYLLPRRSDPGRGFANF